MPKKICSGPCGRELELSAGNFQHDRSNRSGYKSRCKACSSRTLKSEHKVQRADDGFTTTARSTLYNRQGEVVAEWVKTSREQEDAHNALMEALKGLDADWVKPAAVKKPKGFLDEDLLNTIVLGDPHFGQFSWGEETGQDFDLKIAEANMVAAVDHLVDLAPKAKQALFVSVGDFYHADSSLNQTTKGTRVDVDTRWSKMLRVGIRAMRRCIERLLEKHETVHVILATGNHDAHSSIMLALALEQFYENEPRVTVDTSPGKFHWYRHGKCLFGVTHGDTVKMKDLPGIMAVDKAEDWGQTEYRYWLTGHIHHEVVKEMTGAIVESFRTLAPSDAWHKGQGYRSGQDLKLDVYHRKYGRVNRHVVGIRQLWDK